MSRIVIVFIFLLFSMNGSTQCLVPNNIYSSNINYYNANLNWSNTANVHHYKIRYKLINTTTWSYKNNIDSLAIIKNVANLIPLSTYIWQIRSYCDSTNTNFSQWSSLDTFVTNTSLCPTPNGLYTTNITPNNALANWNPTPDANRYVIHYRIYGTSLWSNLGNIDSTMTTKTIPLLQSNTTYEWEIMAYFDSTIQMASLWSAPDTFTTITFVPAPFNPIIDNSISSTLCNTPVDLLLRITQAPNEPDIGASTITTNEGSFSISSLSNGDTIGYASLTTSTQTINTILKVSPLVLTNYAIINSYDSTGSFMGFFSIENLAVGIRVSTTSPNDGNNYTSGMTSNVLFENVFVTPNYTGPLYLFAEIESELNHLINYTDTFQIQCVSSIKEQYSDKQLKKVVDILGREVVIKKGCLLYYIYENGEVEKIFILK